MGPGVLPPAWSHATLGLPRSSWPRDAVGQARGADGSGPGWATMGTGEGGRAVGMARSVSLPAGLGGEGIQGKRAEQPPLGYGDGARVKRCTPGGSPHVAVGMQHGPAVGEAFSRFQVRSQPAGRAPLIDQWPAGTKVSNPSSTEPRAL